MEHARNVRVLEVPYDWNDVGDWRALATLLERDAAGNAIQGHVVARDTRDSIIISDDGGIVATLGVDDLVVVHSGKATLVARKDRLDDLKALVESLAKAGYGCTCRLDPGGPHVNRGGRGGSAPIVAAEQTNQRRLRGRTAQGLRTPHGGLSEAR